MENDKFLYEIHRKIRFRRIRDDAIGSIGAIALCIAVFLGVPSIDEDVFFDDLYESVSYYEWELSMDPTSDEIFDYLMEYTCIENYDEIIDENLMEIINGMNLGG